MRHVTRMVVPILLIGMWAAPGSAQEEDGRARIEAELRELAASPTSADRDRAEVLDFLRSDRVRAVASGMGIDLQEIEGRVATLDGSQAAGLAERIRDAKQDAPLAGGDTFVITSTTVIIVLLVIILIIVA